VSAPVLVLIPGLMCDQAVWAAQCEALDQWGIEFRIADHGELDSLAAMAAKVLASQPGPLAVVGHSMGGRVALEIARLDAARLRGMVLLDTGFRQVDDGAAGRREIEGRMRLLEQANSEGVRAMAASWVQGMVHPERLQDRDLIESILDMFERRTPAHFAAQIKALIERPDATAVLPTISCPTLLLCGEQDAWAKPAQHVEMSQRIAGSRYTCVPHCGHMTPMEQPAALNAALRSWLERLDAFSSSTH
jgi:pimeloyl-ACP methyl ester carboxylesterase